MFKDIEFKISPITNAPAWIWGMEDIEDLFNGEEGVLDDIVMRKNNKDLADAILWRLYQKEEASTLYDLANTFIKIEVLTPTPQQPADSFTPNTEYFY